MNLCSQRPQRSNDNEIQGRARLQQTTAHTSPFSSTYFRSFPHHRTKLPTRSIAGTANPNSPTALSQLSSVPPRLTINMNNLLPKAPSPTCDTTSPPTRLPLTSAQISTAMSTCLALQTTATTLHSKRPFAALLLAPDNLTVLLTHFSISHFQHAESEVVRLACLHFSQPYLWTCTLVSTWEPCAMCTGTLYWGNIGRLVYAASEESLRELTGGGNEENMTMNLPCRTVLGAGQKDVEVLGPLGVGMGGWEGKVVEASRGWWREHTEEVRRKVDMKNGTGGVNGNANGYVESVYSTQNDDGEYEAHLDIDWLR